MVDVSESRFRFVMIKIELIRNYIINDINLIMIEWIKRVMRYENFSLKTNKTSIANPVAAFAPQFPTSPFASATPV